MARPLLASAVELAARTGRSATDQNLVGALQDASRRFRGAVHHEVHRVAGDVLELDGTGGRIIMLPAVPIVSITSLVLDDDTELVAGTDYSVRKSLGLLRSLNGCWPVRDGFATITYTHGYDATPVAEADADEDNPAGSIPGLPDDIQAAVLDMAQILLNVDAGVQSKTVLGDSVQFGAAASVGTTQVWSDAVDNHIIARSDRA